MKQLMVARQFPAHHPRAGEPTHFVEKIWSSLYETPVIKSPYWPSSFELIRTGILSENWSTLGDKGHTIRDGKRWKTGDMAELKVWSGRPYNSKTITITPPLELTVFDVEINQHLEVYINGNYWCIFHYDPHDFECWHMLAENDGLSAKDLKEWFVTKKFTGFSGQILSWNPDIKY